MFITNLARKAFGTRNERLLKRYYKAAQLIQQKEPLYRALTDAELSAKTAHFKQELALGKSLDQLLPDAFATVREAALRLLKMRHFEVQLVGGMVIHEGRIAEMRTGEGKTLVATLPAYLNALTGKGVHIVTVNDYLAKRDAAWNRPLFEYLGLTVGVNTADQSPAEKQAAYRADITYGTNDQFGFDYLRDNMVFELEERVQRPLHFCIIDEVDSILIDEARTPLVISGAEQDSSELYARLAKVVPLLTRQSDKEAAGDYWVDEKDRQVHFSEAGHEQVERWLTEQQLLKEGESLYEPRNLALMHYLQATLKAHMLFKRDVDYIVRGGTVVIVDEHTGRIMPGRRWSDGIHQAVEAKEKVQIQGETQTLASITFQNYFRLYEKVSGMTGTADTEAAEFQQIYGLETVVIPTNQPMVRADHADIVFAHQKDKFNAIVQDVVACREKGQPVLVGTVSIEISEHLSILLAQKKIPHQVLNAKQHEREAEIIAEAGRPGAVTIATNMAGRGTDIVLGGRLGVDASEEETALWKERHDTVLKAGGLRVIGSERHESRRIDNQLRGRSGRQGDPGSTQFYLSLEDHLLRLFIPKTMLDFLRKGMAPGEAIASNMITRLIENAQKKVEGHHFDVRKQLLEFDDIANDQRQVIYHLRNRCLEQSDISDLIAAIREEVVRDLLSQHCPKGVLPEAWDEAGLKEALMRGFGIEAQELQTLLKTGVEWLSDRDLLELQIVQRLKSDAESKEAHLGSVEMQRLERSVMLSVMDEQWRDHLATMEYLRHSIHLRGYVQKDPKQEYRRESLELLKSLLNNINYEAIRLLSILKVQKPEDVAALDAARRRQRPQQLEYQHSHFEEEGSGVLPEEASTPEQERFRGAKVGRNEPCPCGSGRKYKHCHGKV